MKLSIFTKGLRFPEGPVWMPDGSVLVSEIAGGTIQRCRADGSRQLVATLGGGPNGAAVGPDGALYVCNNGGLEYTEVRSRGWLLPGDQPEDYRGGSVQRVDLATGEVRVLYEQCNGIQLKGPNDIVFDAHGGFWFTDHGKLRPRDRDRGGVHYASIDGRSIREVLMPLDGPNGIGLSPDGKRLYVVESFTARVWAWDIVGPGELAIKPRARVFGGQLMVGLGGYHLFDSMAVDRDGNLCIATLGDHCGITVITPDARSQRHIDLPGPMPTNICFDAEMKMAYATLSPQGELAAWEWSSTVSPDFGT